jgi:hypothetical protein
MATQLDGGSLAPLPIVLGVINGTNGVVIAFVPSANGALLASTWLNGAVTVPMPTADGKGDLSYNGVVVAPLPVAVADLLIGWAGVGDVTAPFAKVTSTMLHGWVGDGAVIALSLKVTSTLSRGWAGAVVAPMPTINALLAASIPVMSGAVTVTTSAIATITAFPTAFGILSEESADTFTVMAMNLKNRLVSFYQNYNFNSACPFNGGFIAAGSDGIYLLSGTDDNGTPIDASILLGDMNFGTDYIKTNPEMFINYSGSGPLQVSVIRDQGDETDGPYEVPEPRGIKLETNRAKIPQGLRGAYYQFLIENVDCSIVNIQNIRMKFLKSQRTIH